MSVLSMIANPAQADILGAMDKGKKRQAKDMAGEILGQTQYGQLGALFKTDVDMGMRVAGALGIPTSSKGRMDAMKGAYTLSNQFAQAGDLETAALVMEDYVAQVQGSTQGQEMAQTAMKGAEGLRNGDPETLNNLNTIVNSFSGKQKKFTQATAKGMEGWNFDESTGEFSLPEGYANFLNSDAAKKSKLEFLDAKNIASVNDKVTALIKEPQMINSAARDLISLEEGGSVTDQIAAVFKFMKAMDPSSTVRESELDLIYNAEGAAQGFANSINALLGGGKINDSNFGEIVNTAKLLANASAASGGAALDGYLEVIQDNMTPKQYKAMRDRMPTPFKMTTKVNF